jgi:hypothetical protein
VPGIGLTIAEEKGLATKHDRFLADGGNAYYPNLALRGKDRPFQRLERYAKIMKAPEIRYGDLKSLVDVEITFSSLPFGLHLDNFRLNDTHVIVPLTLEFSNKDLEFKDENGVHRAKIAVYGSVSDLGNRIVNEFEDDVMTVLRADQLQRGLSGRAMYQKLLVLEKGRRVKLNLVVKDLNSGKVGAVSRAIVPPGYDNESLQTSSLVLSDTMQKLENIPDEDEMFVLGDILIRPSLDRRFPMDKLMGAYVQVYNAGIDQSTFQPSLKVKYTLFRDGKELMAVEDEQGESVDFFSASRIVLTRTFSPANLGPGKYRILIEIVDKITNQMATVGNEFQVVTARQLAAAQ